MIVVEFCPLHHRVQRTFLRTGGEGLIFRTTKRADHFFSLLCLSKCLKGEYLHVFKKNHTPRYRGSRRCHYPRKNQHTRFYIMVSFFFGIDQHAKNSLFLHTGHFFCKNFVRLHFFFLHKFSRPKIGSNPESQLLTPTASWR